MRFANLPFVKRNETQAATLGRSCECSQTRSRLQRGTRGMTLVEVMIVVVIVGILSALGIYGIQKYLNSAQASEAYGVINSIRGAQEVYRQDTFRYLDVSQGNFSNTVPAGNPDGRKTGWGGTSETATRFKQLGVEVDSAVAFHYACVAGATGDGFPTPPTEKTDFGLPETASEPFYVIVAKGNSDGDSVYAYMLTHSLTNEVYVEHESE